MNKLSHEVLLALSYVSQISDPASVKSRFFESLNGLGAEYSFQYADQPPSEIPELRVLPIATLRSSFGYAVMAECPVSGEADMGVFRSAFKFLAVILENRIQAQELEWKNISLLREISHEKSLLRTVFDTLPVGVWVVDRDGMILVGNAAGGKIWGGTSCIGMDRYSDYKAWWPDTGKRIENEESAVARAIKQGETLVGQEINIECFDGVHKTILNSAAPLLDDEQGVIGAVCVNQDITERKRAEEEKLKLEAQLQQAQKMEAVGQLAGGVAHDFNNMLGVIMGHAEMAMTQMHPAHPVFGDLEGIRKAAGRSADITRQLLAFARKQAVVPKVLDLNEIVEGMLKMLRRLIGEGIDLAWLPGASLWPVKVDPSQFDQILVNLCVNARDALPGVGKLTVETENRTLEEEACAIHTGLVSGEYVRIAVSDNGCGMDKETLSHIFEPFFTTKGVGQGTGLGLSTVYGAIKQNGGFVNAYSEPGQGTTFSIYLPRYGGPMAPAPTASGVEPLVGGKETILLVEDEPTILTITTALLEYLGYTVLAPSSPGEAIRMAGEHSSEIHLLLTDVIMPEMNGKDLAARLWPDHPHLKCLFMSGYTSDVIAQHGILDEGVQFIQKPFSIKDLAIKVRAVLEPG